jgi:hypothetical protein
MDKQMTEERLFFEDMPELDFLTDLESELGIAPAFFKGLLDEDDWSFVIELHSLIEAATTHFLHTLSVPQILSVELNTSRASHLQRCSIHETFCDVES